jgi:hypothetical protein
MSLRLDEGPLGEDVARELLLEWWASNADQFEGTRTYDN